MSAKTIAIMDEMIEACEKLRDKAESRTPRCDELMTTAWTRMDALNLAKSLERNLHSESLFRRATTQAINQVRLFVQAYVKGQPDDVDVAGMKVVASILAGHVGQKLVPASQVEQLERDLNEAREKLQRLRKELEETAVADILISQGYPGEGLELKKILRETE